MKKNILFLVLLALILQACPIDPNIDKIATVTIKNKTYDTIGYYYKKETSIYDTILPIEKPLFQLSSDNLILIPNSIKTHYIFGKDNLPDLQKYMDVYVIIYYFFNYDSINILPWSEIRERNIFMKRIIIDTKNDYEKLNYEIAYP
jgi:hypothetical protein